MARVRRKRVGGIVRLLVVAVVAAGLQLVGATITNNLAAADHTAAAWAQLRQCESSGNYNSIGPAGHYGAYQFDQPTWNSVGGTGLPNQASQAEQDFRSLYLYRMRGWEPWACGNTLKLVADS